MKLTILLSISALLLFVVFLWMGLVPRQWVRNSRKNYYLLRSLLGVELGIRGLLNLFIYYGLLGGAIAVLVGMRGDSEGNFDFRMFGVAWAVVVVCNVSAHLVNSSSSLQRYLAPGAGAHFRIDRKFSTAAVLKRIDLLILDSAKENVDPEKVNKLLQDILDLVVSHVGDHRGIRKDFTVFSSIIIVIGQKLVVIVRDPRSTKGKYQREVPKEYDKAELLSGRAIINKRALVIGSLREEYPELLTSKPYESVLAIPLVSGDGERTYGALSIDSPIPYFFETYRGDLDNDFENSLQPYIELITLVIEVFLGTEPEKIYKRLF